MSFAGQPATIWFLLILWLFAIIVASRLDAPVALRVYSSGLYNTVRWSRIAQISKAPGTYYVSLVIAAILWCWPGRGVRAACFLLLSGAVAGLFYATGKWMVGRSRPIFDNGKFNSHPFAFDYFHGGLHGLLMNHPNLSFPSGHTCLAFASATALAMMIPRWSGVFFTIALIVAAERIFEGAHYVSDVVAGAGLGVPAAIVASIILRRLNFMPAESNSSSPNEAVNQ